MGSHPDVQNGQEGWNFRVWAPDVESVRVSGEFNGWSESSDELRPIAESGVWTGFVPGARQGQLYKYVIETKDGRLLHKADPYAFFDECPPGTASRLWTLEGYDWGDGAWLDARRTADRFKEPFNIYEVHLGSWKRHGDAPRGLPRADGTYPGPGDPFPAQRGEWYSYDELADELVAYVQEMGYTHIELLPVMEHPFDGSWGYQPTGYYAPTARYGTPQQLMRFVDACHQAGIGVVMDWVAGGFCADAHGLATFNGEMLYEREIHPNWGTHKFDFSRGEVVSFLVSNALFWIENYHIDGIRMDGVTSMLYLNFGVENPADKKFNEQGGEEDLDAVAFVRKVNTCVGRAHPDVTMIAEESSAWPLVTRPPEDGGLGFHFKWNMGWMNDTLRYMQTDFPWRPGSHKLLTFSLMYAFSENFMLPLSHDEVVNGKSSLIGRMPGDWWRQFAGLRTLAFWQMTHPGAKLSFMGNEIGQFIEWRYYESIEWFLTEKYPTHAKHQAFIAALNKFYLAEPALWQRSCEEEGFEWIDPDDSQESIVSYVRHGDDPDDDLVVIINFDPATHMDFRVGVPREGDWKVVFDTDEQRFGGNGCRQGDDGDVRPSQPVMWDQQMDSIVVALPSLAGLALKRVGPSSWRKKAEAKKERVQTQPADAMTPSSTAAVTSATASAAGKVPKPAVATARAPSAEAATLAAPGTAPAGERIDTTATSEKIATSAPPGSA